MLALLCQDCVISPGGDFTAGRKLYNWPVPGPRLRKGCPFGEKRVCHISSKLLWGSHSHLPFPTLAKVWCESFRFHGSCLKPGIVQFFNCKLAQN